MLFIGELKFDFRLLKDILGSSCQIVHLYWFIIETENYNVKKKRKVKLLFYEGLWTGKLDIH